MASHIVHAARIGTVSVVLAALVSSVSVAHAGVETCVATDVTAGGVPSSDLQGVIDAANSGDSVEVEGVCAGRITVSKDLTLVGIATQAYPVPTLDGNGLTKVLLVRGGRATDVALTDLTITNGLARYGAGI